MTKANERIYNQFINSNCYNLFDCYRKPSKAKLDAFMRCLQLSLDFGAYRARILSANCQMFSFAFEYELNGVPHLHYMTNRSEKDFVID